MKFTELEKTLREQGYCDDDTQEFDKFSVELRDCLKCRVKLTYRGFSVINRYRGFGVCLDCNRVREFFNEFVPSPAPIPTVLSQ